jgi:hypothetical protein
MNYILRPLFDLGKVCIMLLSILLMTSCAKETLNRIPVIIQQNKELNIPQGKRVAFGWSVAGI